jgi:4-amino-4-deoxy-L-arabinose transferase-like glycosyltransferase
VKKYQALLAVLAILLLAGIMRFVNVTTSPGYEWDEPVYAAISQRTVDIGYPNLKNEGNVYSTNVYLFHPPFDYYLKGYWFQLLGTPGEIGSGRILSVIEGMIALLLAFFCLKEVSGVKTGLIGLVFLATDGWLVYTNRMNLMENGMMPWGLLGIWFYIKATKTGKTRYYLMTGTLLALAAVYKHTGIPFVLVPIVNFLITRRDWKNHLVTFLSIMVVGVMYVLTMMYLWQDDFLLGTWVQIERVLGNMSSRGLNYGLDDVVSAVVQTYWVFVATVVSIIVVGLTTCYRLFQVVFRGHTPGNSILLSWALVAFAFLAVIALKAPHYLITVLIPAYMFIASELGNWLDKQKNTKGRQWVVCLLMTVVVMANLVTWDIRLIQRNDNALLETFNFFKSVPVTARVIADECIGSAIQQPYYNLDRHPAEQGLKEVNPDYIVIYSSLTQKPPLNPALNTLLSKSALVKHIKGFKETIDIYKIN